LPICQFCENTRKPVVEIAWFIKKSSVVETEYGMFPVKVVYQIAHVVIKEITN